MRYYFSYSPFFALEETASQTGTHVVYYDLYGKQIHMSNFDATTGAEFSIPNIFPEFGSFRIWIVQPDGTQYTFPDECGKRITIRHACDGELDYTDC